MEAVRPVGGQTKKTSLRVAAAIASAVGLVALSVRMTCVLLLLIWVAAALLTGTTSASMHTVFRPSQCHNRTLVHRQAFINTQPTHCIPLVSPTADIKFRHLKKLCHEHSCAAFQHCLEC